MINAICECGVAYSVAEADVTQPLQCRKCGRSLRFVTAEPLDDGAGAADFDARLVVEAGPMNAGQPLLLGGVADIALGKLPECNVCLAGSGMVSRNHCRLQRVDFGPSRWKVVDNKSTNGLFVNGQRVAEKELEHDDLIQVGEYRLRYLSDAARAAPVSNAAEMEALAVGGRGSASLSYTGHGGTPCPSCDQPLAPGAKICVRCGIYAHTGRPLITAQGMDEDALYVRAETWIRFVSFLVWVTPLPMPIASEAYGGRKPYTIWAIAALTVLISIIFFASQNGAAAQDTKNLMLWNPKASPTAGNFSFEKLSDAEVNSIVADLEPAERNALSQAERALKRQGLSAADARRRAMRQQYAEQIAALEAEVSRQVGQFRPYQLLSHALLHDTSNPIGFVMHLGGNLLFLLVFGTRVNSLIGNVATVVCYPLLAVSAGAIHLATLSEDDPGPMLGASGAIMGLAGMYLVLFPVHRVYCAMWIRIRWSLFAKIFTLRGFWVLLIYFAYDVAMQVLFSDGDGVAHWAHMGGFLTGTVLALGVLFSRQFNCRGADLLSVALGRHAWPLIGKPSRWGDRTAPAGVPAVPAAAMAHPVYGAVPQRL